MSYQKKLKVKSAKGLTKDLVNGYNIVKGEKYIFFSEILPNYLVFISAKKYLEFFAHISETYSWKSKGMSEKIATSGNTFAPTLIDTCQLPDIKFNGNCLLKSNTPAFRKLTVL